MKYSQSNAIGDAGEHYFAYKVAKILGWPCRLLDIDIGIDAQIEILDAQRNSTGQFLAVQIKATTVSGSSSLRVNLKHIKYWRTVQTPVLLALVDIKQKVIYWKYVGALPTDSDTAGRRDVSIVFNPSSDLLSRRQIPALSRLGFAKDIGLIEKTLNRVAAACDTILRQTADHDAEIVEDFHHYLEMMRGFRRLETQLHQSKILVQRIRRAVGDCGYIEALAKFRKARTSLIRFMRDSGFSEHEGAEIDAFENEYVETTRYLQLDA